MNGTTRAIRFARTGGPEVLEWIEQPLRQPGAGEALVAHRAVGLNFIDTYHRNGLYKVSLPNGLGIEAAGVVEAVGAGVAAVRVGDRVAYAGGPLGAYAQKRVMPADRLVKLPEAIDFQTAAAMMLKGMTVEYLIRRTFKVAPGMTVLWHAAAGGVGLIACQWLRALGVTMIGTVGSDEKAALARAHGCTHTIVYTRENIVERVRALTGGKGVPVVFDAVGKSVYEASLDCLAPRGMYVNFGNASGPIPPVDALMLSHKGSLYLTRPTLVHYTAERTELLQSAAALFDVVADGRVTIDIGQRYALADAGQAHRALEARRTTGSTVLLV